MNNPRTKVYAFTIIELLVVVVLLAMLSAMLMPALARTKVSVQRVSCGDNLKRIGMGFQTWSSSHSDSFPMSVSTANGGFSESVGLRTVTTSQATTRGVFDMFLAISNELSTPKILICPAENEGRLAATTFSGFITPGSNQIPFTNDLNTSYFIGVDATVSGSQTILSGDHNMGSDGNIVPFRGFVTPPSSYSPSFAVSLGTNFVVNSGPGWLDTMHSKQGNVLMNDCSVQQLNRTHLQSTLSAQRNLGGFGGSFPLPVGCSGFGMNRIQFP